MKKLTLILISLLAIHAGVYSQTRPFPQNVNYGNGYTSGTIPNSTIQSWYNYWLNNAFSSCGSDELIKFGYDNPNEAVSEGIAYGMLITAYFGNKTKFDNLWAYYKRLSNEHGLMMWHTTCSGAYPELYSDSPASDAEIDAAYALLVAQNQWGGNYKNEAITLINAIKQYETTVCGDISILKPGEWGGCNEMHIDYFDPGYYRVFYEATGDNFWADMANDAYVVLNRAAHPSTGLIPEMCDINGAPVTKTTFNSGPCRLLWRVTRDYLWYGEPQAKTLTDNMTNWGNGIGIQNIVGEYEIDGTPLVSWRAPFVTGAFAVGAMTHSQSRTDNWADFFETDNVIYGYYNLELRILYALTLTGNYWKPGASTPPPLQYTLNVTDGTGDGDYAEGTVVDIAADAAPGGHQFAAWTGDISNVANVNDVTTTITMPANDVSISASYQIINNGWAIPGKIEAEAFSVMSGIQTQTTTDDGGGENIGWVDVGDWLDYNVDVASAGQYEVTFRLASQSNGANFDLKQGGTVLTSVNEPATGGWQSWVSVTKTVSLSADLQTLRIEATGGGWNLNWFEFTDPGNGNTYALSVTNGSGDGDYEEGTIVNITADAAPSRQQFTGWTGDISYVADVNSANTTVTMPASTVSLTASYTTTTDVSCGEIQNYSFENGLINWTNNGNSTITTNANTGGAALKTGTGEGGVHYSTMISVGSNTEYDFSVYAKTEGSPSWAGIGLDFLDASNAELNENVISSFSTSYQQKSLTGTLPDGTSKIRLWTYKSGSSGSLFLDDVCLTLSGGTTNTYALSVTNGSGDGDYEEGTIVNITADGAPSGQQFTGWTGDVSYIADVSSAITTLTMPAANVSVTAGYGNVPTYALNVTNGTGDGDYAEGTVVDIAADPAPAGQQFNGWAGDIQYLANPSSSNTTVTMPATAVSITATYATESISCSDYPVPSPDNWILRNDWSNQNGSTMSMVNNALAIDYPQWGQSEFYLIQKGVGASLESGKDYIICFDIKGSNIANITEVSVGFSNGYTWFGPTGYAIQLSSAGGNISSSSYTSKEITLTANTTGSGNLTLLVTLTGQPNQATSYALKNVSICAAGEGGQNIPVSGVTVSPENISLNFGDIYALSATVSPSDATNKNVNWSSDNQGVATVDATGTITAVSEGSTVVTATTEDGGFMAASNVSVTSDPVSNRYEAEDAALSGCTVESSVTGYSGTGYVEGTTYSNPDIISWTANGIAAGNYDIIIGYNGAFGAKEQELIINGSSKGNIQFNNISGWATVNAGSYSLNANNTIELKASWGWMHVDYIELVSLKSGVILSNEIADSDDNNILVYPNPVKQSENVYLKHTFDNVIIRIIDVQGKVIHVQKYQNEKEITIPTENLREGLYILQVNESIHKLMIK